MVKNILIIGGSSGLGLELAKQYAELGHKIFITGRTDPNIPQLNFFKLAIDADSTQLRREVDNLFSALPAINTLVYAAGFYQEGRIDQLNDNQILEMINVGLSAPAILIRHLKNNPGKPLKIILITSSSQYTPRELEPVYTAVKAGLGMLGNSLALDPELGKVVVVAPSGMQTNFWAKAPRDLSKFLDPKWVAQQIIELSGGEFKYKYFRILRDPQRVEVIETR